MSINPLYAWGLVAVTAIGVVAVALNVQLAFWLGFFVVMGVWAWYSPQPALYLLIVVAPVLPMLKITQTIGLATLLKDVLILVLFLKFFLVPLLTKQLPYRRNILALPLVFLAGWVLFGIAQADSLILGILRARDIGLYALLFLAVLFAPPTKRFYTDALGWLLASSGVVALLGWYQFFAVPDSAVLRFDPARQLWIPRVSSIMAHPSIFGQYVVTVVVLLAALVINTTGRLRVGFILLFAFFTPLVYLTFSRAVWLGYLVGLGAAAVAYGVARLRTATKWRVPWKWGAIAFLVVLVGITLVVRFTSAGVFLRTAIDPTYASNAERLEFLARLIAPLSNKDALVGAGLGDVLVQNFRTTNIDTFDIASGASREVQLAKNQTLVDNQYLKTFVELGLAGLLIYAWIYWRIARAALQLTSHQVPVTRTIGFWAIGFLAAFLIQALFIDIWDIFPTNMAFWIIAALMARELTPYTEGYEKS